MASICLLTWLIIYATASTNCELNTPSNEEPLFQEILATVGSTITLTCGSSHEKFDNITWWRNDTGEAVASKEVKSTFINTNYTDRIQIYSKRFILSSCRVSDSSFYYCETSRDGDIAQGDFIKLIIEEKPSCEKTVTKVISYNGSSIFLPCYAKGNPTPTITWTKLDQSGPLKSRFVVSESGLTIHNLEVTDTGKYQVTLDNKIAIYHYITQLSVISTHSVKPENYKAGNENFPVIIECGKRPAKPGDTIEWLKGGLSVVTPGSRFSVDKNGSLVISKVLREDSGLYECASRRMEADGEMTFSINMFLNVRYAPSIMNIKPVVAVYEGDSALLPCSASGNPGVTFRWLFPNGAVIIKNEKFELSTNGSLIIRNARMGDAKNYTCAPYNKIGDGEHAFTMLRVFIPPAFLSKGKDITSRVNQDITLDCSASGIPTPNVTWARDRNLPFDEKRVIRNPIGLLTIKDVQGRDSGGYHCVVESDAGKIKRSLKLQVIGKPGTPHIVDINTRDSIAYVEYEPSYDGGSRQIFEFWYREGHLTEYNWKVNKPSINYTKGNNKFDIHLKGPNQFGGRDVSYWFSIRAKNKEGYSEFSDVFKVVRSSMAGVTLKAKNMKIIDDEPLAPYDFVVNITDAGYGLQWGYLTSPGRPVISRFEIKYQTENATTGWVTITTKARKRRSVTASYYKEKRLTLLAEDMPGVKHPLQFEIASIGPNNKRSPSIKPEKYTRTGMPGTVLPVVSSNDSDMIPPIVLGCIFAVFIIVLIISLYCFCRRRKQRRYQAGKNEKKMTYNTEHGVDYDGISDTTDGAKLLSPSFSTVDSPRRFHLRNCPALALGKFNNHNMSNGTAKDDVFVLLEPNDSEQRLCTCNKKYVTLNSRDQKTKREKKKGLYKSTSSPSVLLTSDMDASSLDPSELLDEEDYDISDVEKDDVAELIQDPGRFTPLNRKNFKDSYDQFCRPDEKTEVDKNMEVALKLKEINDASSENSATESDRVTTPLKKQGDMNGDGKSSGFGDGSNSTSDSESISHELADKAGLLRPHPYNFNGYISDTGRRDPGYASDISTRSSPQDYAGRHNKYLPPSQRHNTQYNNNNSARPPSNLTYFSEDDSVPSYNSSRRQQAPPSYTQAIVDIERLSEKNDITDSEEMFGNLLEMERQLGVTLDDSLDSDLNIKTTLPPQPPVLRPYSNPRETGYMSDSQYSDREKTARCKQLLSEFKSSRGDTKFDDIDDVEEELPVESPAVRSRSVMDSVITEEPRVPPVLRRSNSAGSSSVYKEWLV